MAKRKAKLPSIKWMKDQVAKDREAVRLRKKYGGYGPIKSIGNKIASAEQRARKRQKGKWR